MPHVQSARFPGHGPTYSPAAIAATVGVRDAVFLVVWQ